MATAVVAVIGLVFITLFYSLSDGVGDPFGAYNDICVGLGGILSGLLALIIFPIHRAYTPRASLTKDTGLAYVEGDQTFNKEQAPCLLKILSRNCFAA